MTIKTQGGKVITKGGKMSCECCETECCLYPAQAFFEGIYGWDDLPDTLYYGVAYENIEFTLTKQTQGNSDPFDGAENIYFGADESGELFRIILNFYSFSPNAFWELQIYGNPWGPTAGEFGSICLIGDQQAESVYDLFANSYSVTGPISGIVTRRTDSEGANPFLVNCQYLGTGLSLRYSSTSCKWQINGNPKIGFQNTPVGSYEGGYTVS